MSYTSRNQARTALTEIPSAIPFKSIERYDVYYDLTYDACARRVLPFMTVRKNSVMIRNTSKGLDIEQGRTIDSGDYNRDSSAMVNHNRYSGRRLNRMPGQGALYTATISGVLREHAHYTGPGSSHLYVSGRDKPHPDKLKQFISNERNQGGSTQRNFHLYTLETDLFFADLRLSRLFRFFASLPANVLKRYGIAENSSAQLLAAKVNDPIDYSAARGMADAVYDAPMAKGHYHGVCAFSARADSDNGMIYGGDNDPTTGLVFAIFGAPGTVVSSLKPVQTFSTFSRLKEYMLNSE